MAATQRRWRSAAGWSALYAAALVALYVVAVVTPIGQRRLDTWGVGIAPVPPWFQAVRVGMPLLVALVAAGMVVVGLVHRQWDEVLTCVLCAAVVIWLCGVLRDDVFVRPSYGFGGPIDAINSYPSRHVAITCALSIVVVRLWPWLRSRRIVVASAMAAVAVASVASFATYAHRVSDTFGAVLLVGVFAVVFARGRVPPVRFRPRAWSIAGVVALAVCLLAAVVAWATTGGVSRIADVVLIAVGTAGLTALVMRIAAPSERTIHSHR